MTPSWHSETFVNGIHAFVGGSGTSLISFQVGPEKAEAYINTFPALSKRHRVFMIDP
jgi:hypothetical protein